MTLYSESQSTFIYVGPQLEPTKSVEADAGCWIDASAFMADELHRRIISEMLSIHHCKFFIDTDMDQWVKISNKENSDLTLDESEWLMEVADAAVEWLNEHKASEGYYFIVMDNSLFFEPIVDEASLSE